MTHRIRVQQQLALAALIVLVFGVLILPASRALLWANIASLRETHSGPAAALPAYAHALRAAPNDQHLRWRYGAALYAAGHWSQAGTVLGPLLSQKPVSKQALGLLLRALIADGRARAALEQYLLLEPRPALLPADAAHLALVALDLQGPADAATAQLIAQALQLPPASAAAQLLAEVLTRPNLRDSPEELRLRAALTWVAGRETTAAVSAAQIVSEEALRRLAAEALKLPVDEITLGPELAVDGGFERSDCRAGAQNACAANASWFGAIWSEPPANRSLFVLGLDRAAAVGAFAMRVDGVVVEEDPVHEPGRAGYWHLPLTLEPSSPYLISVLYRTEDVSSARGAALWLAEQPTIIEGGEQRLPATEGSWRHVIIVGWNKADSTTSIQPLLRSFAQGRVWFDELSIRQLILAVPTTPGEPYVSLQP